MKPKYYFVLPDVPMPIGGHTIQYMIAETLLTAGYDISLVHGSPRHIYPYAQSSAASYSDPGLAKLMRPSIVGRIKELRRSPPWKAEKRPVAPRPHPRIERSAEDVFVIPEFAYCEYAPLFPNAPLVLAAQDVFGLARAYTRDTTTASPAHYHRFKAAYCTSQVSHEAIQCLLNRPAHLIGLPINSDQLAPLPKKFQVAYMPRKRKQETDIVVNALRNRLGKSAPRFVPIMNMTNAERDQTLRESLFFLSFSEMEGFGLPPAEAMAAACIVIGYTGVGGNEYFTNETGFPIQDNDIVSFIQTVGKLVETYQENPAPLDALRHRASAYIHENYDPDNWRQTLLNVWRKIDTDIHRELLPEADNISLPGQQASHAVG